MILFIHQSMIRNLFTPLAIASIAIALGGCNSTKQAAQTVSPNNRICVDLQTPNPGWILGIQEVRVDKDNHLHVYAEAKIIDGQENRIAATVISQISDCVRVPRNGRGMTIYLAGATWNWVPEAIIQVSGTAEYRSKISTGSTKALFPY